MKPERVQESGQSLHAQQNDHRGHSPEGKQREDEDACPVSVDAETETEDHVPHHLRQL